MDLKVYYRKIREAEASIAEPDVVMVSFETPDGGRAGKMTEVSRAAAAKLIVEGRARLATEEERARFVAETQAAREEAKRRESASRIRVAVIPETDLRGQRAGGKAQK